MAESATVAPATDKTTEPEITEPGAYANLPEADYHAHPALSSSGARRLLAPSCPAKFRYERDHGQAPKKTFDLGKAAHKLALGAGAEIHVIDAGAYRTDAAKAERDQAYADGEIPLLVHEYEVVEAMAAALKAHPIAGKLFTAERGQPEQSLFWTDRQSGVFCRARLDWFPIRTGRRLIIPDYKTAMTASPDGWSRAFDQHGYFIQAAWYLAAAKALDLAGDDEPAFLFIVQEKEPPYLVTPFEPDIRSMRAGRHDMRTALNIFAECTRTGRWPGYSDGIELVSLPDWKIRQYESGVNG